MTKPRDQDGGWAWVILGACAACVLVTSGLAILAGIFQNIFLEELQGGLVMTSWVTSLYSSLMQLTGPITGVVCTTMGCRTSIMSGSILLTAGLLMSAYCRDLISLLFTFGICSGLGLGLIYSAAIVQVNLCFHRYRSLATGTVMAAGGVGIMTMPPLTHSLLASHGRTPTLTLLSALSAQLCVAAALLFDLQTGRKNGRGRGKRFCRVFCFNSTKQTTVHTAVDHTTSQPLLYSESTQTTQKTELKEEISPTYSVHDAEILNSSNVNYSHAQLQTKHDELSDNTVTLSETRTIRNSNSTETQHKEQIPKDDYIDFPEKTKQKLAEHGPVEIIAKETPPEHSIQTINRTKTKEMYSDNGANMAETTHTTNAICCSAKTPTKEEIHPEILDSHSSEHEHSVSNDGSMNSQIHTLTPNDSRVSPILFDKINSCPTTQPTKYQTPIDICQHSSEKLHEQCTEDIIVDSNSCKISRGIQNCDTKSHKKETSGNSPQHFSEQERDGINSECILHEGNYTQIPLTSLNDATYSSSIFHSEKEMPTHSSQYSSENKPSIFNVINCDITDETLYMEYHSIHSNEKINWSENETSFQRNVHKKKQNQEKDSGTSEQEKPDARTRQDHHQHKTSVWKQCQSVLCNPSIAIICLQLFLSSAAISIVFVHFVAFCVHKGSTSDDVSWGFSANGLTLTVSRFLIGVMAQDRTMDPLTIYVGMSLVLSVIVVVIPIIAVTATAQICTLAIMGIYGGASHVLLTEITIHCAGVNTLSLAFGLEMISAGIGILVAPPTAGWLVTFTNSYSDAIFLAGILYFSSAFVSMVLSYTRPKWIPAVSSTEQTYVTNHDDITTS